MTGRIGGSVDFRTVKENTPCASFSLACTPSRYREGEWKDDGTLWVRVSCFGQLANSVKASFAKGQPVFAAGKLRVRKWKDQENHERETLEMTASAVGHDLTFGTTVFSKRNGNGNGGDTNTNGEANGSYGDNGGHLPHGNGGNGYGNGSNGASPAIPAAPAVNPITGEISTPATYTSETA
jgi:single-strand DNA-binding protein